ncbi:MAG: phosphatidylglycerophosphatase A [Proteobacteria bacterium]|nr:phosphatidylglycerophosphatase A [Pseudomonadota bacterium]
MPKKQTKKPTANEPTTKKSLSKQVLEKAVPQKAIKKPLPFFHPASLICTFFGVGKIPFAPGTFGSLAAMAIIHLAMVNIELYMELKLAAFAAICFGLGIWACKPYTEALGVHDHGSIVIDEVVGQIVALLVFMVGPIIFQATVKPIYALQGLEWLTLTVVSIYILLFVTFRLFDIFKPWIIRRVQDNMQNPIGIMLDDVLAGIASGLTCAAIYLFFMILVVPWIGKPV